jgi:TIR domain
MADLFISYAHHDSDLVKELSPALEAAGYSTWYYEDKGSVGASYLLQIDEEIERCQAVVVVISPDSVGSDQVSKEVVRAHEAKKKFIPLRRDISHEEFQKRQPEWRMAFGAAVSAEVPPGGAAPIVPRIVDGLRKLGVEPGAAPSQPSSPLRRLSRGAVHGLSARDSKLGALVAAIVGGLGLPYTLQQLSRLFTPGSPEASFFAAFPRFRTVTILVNLAGLVQNALLLSGAWLVRRRDPRGGSLIRKVSLSMVVTVAFWLLVALVSLGGSPAGVQGAIGAALIALVPSGIVFALFRKAGKTP